MPSTCEFKLNRPNGVYFSGQTISGSVVLKTTSEKHIKSIRIRFLGEAKVHWTETRRRRKFIGKYVSNTDFYRANELYVDRAAIVRDGGILPPGTYTFKFNFNVPKSCPTSCSGKHGHIRYVLWLTVIRPFRFDNEFSKPLTILKRVDLNLNPSFKVPLKAEAVSSIGCWPCASGKILYSISVPLGAYASGQTLQYTLNIHNHSMAEVVGYNVQFAEYTTFIAHTPVHKERKKRTVVVRQDYLDPCLCLSNRQIEGKLVLPSLPPDTEGHGIIRVKHTLELEMIVNSCHNRNSMVVPIFIGNVPIRKRRQAPSPPAMMPPQQEQQSPVANDDRIVDVVSEAPSTSTTQVSAAAVADSDMGDPPSYGDLEPPSFEQAISTSPPFLDPDATDRTNCIAFRPLYPMYPEDGEEQERSINESTEPNSQKL